MSIWNDINNAVIEARSKLRVVRQEAYNIGSLAQDPMILRSMSSFQLSSIKRQLKKYNSKTGQWSE